MTKLSIVVKRGEETRTIRAEGLSENEMVSLIREAIGLQNVISKTMPHLTVSDAMKEIDKRKGVATLAASTAKEDEGVSALALVEEERKRARRLPLLGSENRSEFSLEENARTSLANTKLSPDGDRLFRTYCKCPHCDTEHTGRSTKPGNRYLVCFACNGKVAIVPATKDTQIFEGKEIPKLSIDGYYFVAKTEYEESKTV